MGEVLVEFLAMREIQAVGRALIDRETRARNHRGRGTAGVSWRRGAAQDTGNTGGGSSFVVPLHLVTEAGMLKLFSATTVFGTPLDVT